VLRRIAAGKPIFCMCGRSLLGRVLREYVITPDLCSCCVSAAGEPIPLDEAGNPLLGDIGIFLKKAIKAAIPDATLKYIDPTYMVQVRWVITKQQ
jgi:hypothetical protein